jgi:hypothetical protein
MGGSGGSGNSGSSYPMPPNVNNSV